MMLKVAIITGGASGIGFATAKELKSSGWAVSIFDRNCELGEKSASSIGADFYQVDVTNYDNLATAFDSVFRKSGRLDFVFGNAGIVESYDFYKQQTTTPPPALDRRVVDVNLNSVISTAYLAQHYFRLCKGAEISPALVFTASSASLYPAPNLPTYAAVKHAVLGLTRSLAPMMFKKDSIRVSCICPGTIRTNLMTDGWAGFPEDLFTKIEKVVSTVVKLVNDPLSAGKVVEVVGEEITDVPLPQYQTDSGRILMERLKTDALNNA